MNTHACSYFVVQWQSVAATPHCPAGEIFREFESAVQDGVSTLLSSAARAIRAVVPEKEQYRVPEERDEEAPSRAGEPARRRRALITQASAVRSPTDAAA